MVSDSEDEYFDDPIRIVGLSGEEYENNNSTLQDPNTEKSAMNVKSTEIFRAKPKITLNVNFFTIPDNIILLNKCRSCSVNVVDCDKHPRFYKNYRRSDDHYDHVKITSDFNKIASIHHMTAANINNFTKENIPVTKNTIASRHVSEKHSMLQEHVIRRHSTEKEEALKNKNIRTIDFKKNIGLVGVKISGTRGIGSINGNSVKAPHLKLKPRDRFKNTDKTKHTALIEANQDKEKQGCELLTNQNAATYNKIIDKGCERTKSTSMPSIKRNNIESIVDVGIFGDRETNIDQKKGITHAGNNIDQNLLNSERSSKVGIDFKYNSFKNHNKIIVDRKVEEKLRKMNILQSKEVINGSKIIEKGNLPIKHNIKQNIVSSKIRFSEEFKSSDKSLPKINKKSIKKIKKDEISSKSISKGNKVISVVSSVPVDFPQHRTNKNKSHSIVNQIPTLITTTKQETNIPKNHIPIVHQRKPALAVAQAKTFEHNCQSNIQSAPPHTQNFNGNNNFNFQTKQTNSIINQSHINTNLQNSTQVSNDITNNSKTTEIYNPQKFKGSQPNIHTKRVIPSVPDFINYKKTINRPESNNNNQSDEILQNKPLVVKKPENHQTNTIEKNNIALHPIENMNQETLLKEVKAEIKTEKDIHMPDQPNPEIGIVRPLPSNEPNPVNNLPSMNATIEANINNNIPTLNNSIVTYNMDYQQGNFSYQPAHYHTSQPIYEPHRQPNITSYNYMNQELNYQNPAEYTQPGGYGYTSSFSNGASSNNLDPNYYWTYYPPPPPPPPPPSPPPPPPPVPQQQQSQLQQIQSQRLQQNQSLQTSQPPTNQWSSQTLPNQAALNQYTPHSTFNIYQPSLQPSNQTTAPPQYNRSVIGVNKKGIVRKINILTNRKSNLNNPNAAKTSCVIVRPRLPLNVRSQLSAATVAYKNMVNSSAPRPKDNSSSNNVIIPTVASQPEYKVGPITAPTQIAKNNNTNETKTISEVTHKYSPLILPIPAYQQVLGMVQNSTNKNLSNFNHLAFRNNNNNQQNLKRKSPIEQDTIYDKSVKKITLTEYKQRSSKTDDSKCIDLTDDDNVTPKNTPPTPKIPTFHQILELVKNKKSIFLPNNKCIDLTKDDNVHNIEKGF